MQVVSFRIKFIQVKVSSKGTEKNASFMLLCPSIKLLDRSHSGSFFLTISTLIEIIFYYYIKQYIYNKLNQVMQLAEYNRKSQAKQNINSY